MLNKRKYAPRINAYLAEKRKDPAFRRMLRHYHIKCRYGVTIEQIEELREKQNNTCAICGGPPTKNGLVIDHCHATGKFRGLLCNGCNSGIGFFHESVDKMLKAIEYLKRVK
jgi:hypothetical protein